MNWDKITDAEKDASLDDTASLFFSPTEETHGTGIVTRVIKGELTRVVVDETEAAEFAAKCRAEADTRNAEQEAAWELVERLNS